MKTVRTISFMGLTALESFLNCAMKNLKRKTVCTFHIRASKYQPMLILNSFINWLLCVVVMFQYFPVRMTGFKCHNASACWTEMVLLLRATLIVFNGFNVPIDPLKKLAIIKHELSRFLQPAQYAGRIFSYGHNKTIHFSSNLKWVGLLGAVTPGRRLYFSSIGCGQ